MQLPTDMAKTLLLSLAMSAALLASSMFVYATGTSPHAPLAAAPAVDTGR